MIDVAVIGAGLAGLVCAQGLRQHGYSVVVVEKSRGLGGRLATRRLPGAWADHGVRELEVQGELTRQLIQMLCDQNILQPWVNGVASRAAPQPPNTGGLPDQSPPVLGDLGGGLPGYVSPTGITAVAKFLATGLEIEREKRVEAISYANQIWNLTLESGEKNVMAKAIVMAIPAPQALALVEPLDLSSEFLETLRSVTFDPCLTAIATYAPPSSPLPWTAYPTDPDIAWISLENTKSPESPYSVLVVQSTAAFANQHLEAEDLQPIGHHLLTRAANFIPPLGDPDLVQVHRWRYAFARQFLTKKYLSEASVPLVCAGDWCGGKQVESALQSGLAAAEAIANRLNHSPAKIPFSELLKYIHAST
jgi:renalase